MYRLVTATGCSAVGSAPALGAGCREFKSLHSDHKSHNAFRHCGFYFCNERFLIPDILKPNRRLPALGYEHDCVLRTVEGVLIGAAVKILRANVSKEFWAPQEAAEPRMSGVQISSLRPKTRDRQMPISCFLPQC